VPFANPSHRLWSQNEKIGEMFKIEHSRRNYLATLAAHAERSANSGAASLHLGGFMVRNDWHALYRDAVMETNFDQLFQRVNEAEKAIAERLSLNGQVSAEERRELQNARNSLLMLRNERAELRADLDANQ
jgi:hypothetical protein